MLRQVLLVSAGAVVGANARYLLSQVHLCDGRWLNILLVNIVGCFCMGLVSTITKNPDLRMFLMTGLLGAFTTFSSFALDYDTLHGQSLYYGLLYVLASVAGGLGAFYAGRYIAVMF